MDLYFTVCSRCGWICRLARMAEFAPKNGDVLLNWCWKCVGHHEQRVVPVGCIAVYDEMVV